MKYKQMLAFRMVMISGTVTQAAERLNISQPAVSNLIGSLEQHFGFSLFERRKGRLFPTPDALNIYEDIARALSGFEKVSQSAVDIREQKTGSLRIACMPGLALTFIPDVITEFLAERDNVSITLQVQPSLKIQRWIAADLYDIGITELPLIHTGIDCDPYTFKCVCGLPEDHPLLIHEVLTPKDLDGEPFVSLGSEHMTHQQTHQAFADAGAKWRVRVEAQLFWPAARLTQQGCGISILDPFTAADFSNRGLAFRPFLPNIDFKIGILFPAEHPRSLLTEEFSKLIRKRLHYITDTAS
jgi:DNA-binding transcriptional LysR family regulator